jgi:hypothetical protein
MSQCKAGKLCANCRREAETETNGARWATEHPELAKLQGATKHANLSQPSPRKSKPKPAPLPLRAPERAGDVCVIPLPLPSPELQPNRKKDVNRYKLTDLIRGTRAASAFIAKPIAPAEPWTAVLVDVKCYGVGRMDRDGIIGWLKHSIDGLQDCGLIDDDNGVTWGNIQRATAKEAGGRREMLLTITNLGTA